MLFLRRVMIVALRWMLVSHPSLCSIAPRSGCAVFPGGFTFVEDESTAALLVQVRRVVAVWLSCVGSCVGEWLCASEVIALMHCRLVIPIAFCSLLLVCVVE